ncbi:MAG TPA: 2-phosphosulfolactate phosphatase, partial [Azospira sp.]|nr:2-phosphosulfolactate phosphatase [Azospira sp.]
MSALTIDRRYLNRLTDAPEPTGAVVVIDVLRSFSTAAWAIHQGARELYPVASPSDGFRLQLELPEALLVGAIGGGAPIPGYHYGNSPSEVQGADLRGHPLIHCTAAGVRGLSRFQAAPLLFGAALVNAKATAAAIRQAGAEQVTLVITGEWTDRDGDEDIACADYLEALLRDEPAEAAEF